MLYSDLDIFSHYKDLIYHSDIGTTLYNELSSTLSNKNITLDNIYQELLKIIEKKQLLPLEYIDTYLDSFSFETAMNIYHVLFYHTVIKNERHITQTKRIKNYLTAIKNDPNDTIDFSNEISKKKSRISKEFEYVRNKIRTEGYRHYAGTVIQPVFDNTATSLSDTDYIFNIKNYHEFIYTKQHCETGIQFNNLYSVINDYLVLHDNKNETYIEKDYSCYMFEQMHHAIQYPKLIYALLSEYPDADKLPSESMELFIYSQIFKTSYISLTEHVLNLFSIQHFTAFQLKNDIEQHYIFDYINILNNFWLPLILSIIIVILYENYNQDRNTILEMLKIYLNQFQQNDFTYHNQLQNVCELVKKCMFPGGHKGISKDITLAQKTNSPNHIFNNMISMLFYTQEARNHTTFCELNNLNKEPFYYTEKAALYFLNTYYSLQKNSLDK